jgi:hypothetical protein
LVSSSSSIIIFANQQYWHSNGGLQVLDRETTS